MRIHFIAFILGITGFTFAESLPGTKPLGWDEPDLSERLMDGAHLWVESAIAGSLKNPTPPDARALAEMTGVVDERISPVAMERFGDDENPALVAETESFQVFQVRWPVLDGVNGEGLLVTPHEKSKGIIIVVPDASQTPEALLGLAEGDEQHRAFVRKLATDFTLVIPVLIDREIYLGDSGSEPQIKKSNQTHREWIYRQAFHMGRHIIGYEIQRILAIVDWAHRTHPGVPVSMTGYGEGGMLAFFSAALDPRIEAVHVRGYIGSRDRVWEEPIDRNLYGRLSKGFTDAGVAGLLKDRPLLIDGIDAPSFEGKGKIPNPDWEEVSKVLSPSMVIVGGNIAFPLATRFFENPKESILNPLGYLQNGLSANVATDLIQDQRKTFQPQTRHDRLFKELERHVQRLIGKSEAVRDQAFLYQAEPLLSPGNWSTNKAHPTLDPANFIANSRRFRDKFRTEAIGEFAAPLAPPNPRTRKILETEKWTAWDVVLDVYPGFFAWGTMLLPKNMQPGEKRPVVVCQHGRNGLPRDTIDAGNPAYNNYAARLAEEGFITFSPHNLYRGEDRYRWLDRKANSIGCSLFSFIVPSHRQILDWLKTQPNVDPGRIAFYGLSYGGETAVRVPPLVEDYAAVICSGDFNQWTRKVAAVDFPGSFMKTIEWEMPYWNWGNTFDYSEMAALIFPRPFMVERGHHDRVSTDSRVAHEYARVRWLYTQFGMADRTEIEFFQGGHSINGQGSFAFLRRHLQWPQ